MKISEVFQRAINYLVKPEDIDTTEEDDKYYYICDTLTAACGGFGVKNSYNRQANEDAQEFLAKYFGMGTGYDVFTWVDDDGESSITPAKQAARVELLMSAITLAQWRERLELDI